MNMIFIESFGLNGIYFKVLKLPCKQKMYTKTIYSTYMVLVTNII